MSQVKGGWGEARRCEAVKLGACGLDIRKCTHVPVLCCARRTRSRAPAELECLCGGPLQWSCRWW